MPIESSAERGTDSTGMATLMFYLYDILHKH